jgi:hypothetical protein
MGPARAQQPDYSYIYKSEVIALNASRQLVAVTEAGIASFSAEAGVQELQRHALSDREALRTRNLALYQLPAEQQIDFAAALRSFAPAAGQEVQPVFEQGGSLLIPSNELIVAFDTLTDQARAREILAPHIESQGIVDVRPRRRNSFLFTIDNPSNGRVYEVSRVLSGVDGISFAEPNHIVLFLDPNERATPLLDSIRELMVPSDSSGAMRLFDAAPAAATSALTSSVGWTTFIDEDFEDAALPAGWTTARRDDTVVDATWNVTNHRAHSGARSAYATGGGTQGVAAPGNYPDNCTNWLATPTLNLAGYEEVYIEFWFYGKFGTNTSSAYDLAAVLLQDVSSGTLEFPEGTPLPATWVGYTGDLTADPTTDNGWRRALFRVPPSMRINGVRAEFWFTADASGSAEGIYIDEVRIVGTAEVDATLIGNDAYSGRLYEMQNTGQLAGNGGPDNDMQVAEAWELVTPSPSITVAVVDSGVDLTHPDLNLVRGYDPDGTGDGRARGSHGTSVAGNVGAIGDNTLGVMGTAPGVQIMPIFMGSSLSEVADALDTAVEKGADVITNSWGWVGAPSSEIESAIRDALDAGVSVLFAAGNGPDRSPFTYDVAFPGSLTDTSDVITVGASSPTDEHKAAASSDGSYQWGSSYVGPGPDVVAPSPWSYSTDIQGAGGYHDGSSLPEEPDSANYTPYFGGTSSATPKVAGVVALMLSANPSLTPAHVKSILKSTADDIDLPNEDDKTGAGRVDAYDAVTEAIRRQTLRSTEFRFVKLANEVLDGTSPAFQIRLICDETFNVNSFLITARDPGTAVNVDFNRVMIFSNPFGDDLAPPSGWSVGHQDFAIAIGASSSGNELLSNMNVPALGIAQGATFDVIGSRSPNTQATVFTIGAAVETTRDPENECRIVVVDH